MNFDTLRRIREIAVNSWLDVMPANQPHDIVIAGGAVRSLLLGKPVKDVDLFVRIDDDQGVKEDSLQDFLNGIIYELNGSIFPGIEERKKDGLCGSVREPFKHFIRWLSSEDTEGYPDEDGDTRVLSAVVELVGWTPLQVIFIPRSTAAHIAGFPTPVSQCWIGEGGLVQASRAFRRDTVQKILRYAPVAGSYNSKGHDLYMARLAGYFPDWKQVGFAALKPSAKSVMAALPGAGPTFSERNAKAINAQRDKVVMDQLDMGYKTPETALVYERIPETQRAASPLDGLWMPTKNVPFVKEPPAGVLLSEVTIPPPVKHSNGDKLLVTFEYKTFSRQA